MDQKTSNEYIDTGKCWRNGLALISLGSLATLAYGTKTVAEAAGANLDYSAMQVALGLSTQFLLLAGIPATFCLGSLKFHRDIKQTELEQLASTGEPQIARD